MVLRELDDDSVLCIAQSEHARVSGLIARAWGNDAVPASAPATEIELAAEHHDVGMDAFDHRPDLDPATGRPRSFMAMPLGEHVRCWRRGPALVGAENPYAGVLVSLHGSALIGRRSREQPADRELIETYLTEQERLREQLTTQLDDDPELRRCLAPEAIDHNRRLIALWDAMSLAICIPRLPNQLTDTPAGEPAIALEMRRAGGGAAGGERPSGGGGARVEVEPWPFAADAVEIAFEGRRLERRFEREEEMHRSLRRAPLERVEVSLVRPG